MTDAAITATAIDTPDILSKRLVGAVRTGDFVGFRLILSGFRYLFHSIPDSGPNFKLSERIIIEWCGSG
jgi:hypothetical protein